MLLAVLPSVDLSTRTTTRIFDSVPSRFDPVCQDSVVVFVSPLSTEVNKHLNKLEAFPNVCIRQSIIDNEGQQNLTILKMNYSLLFAHPENYVFISIVRQKCLKERGITG